MTLRPTSKTPRHNVPSHNVKSLCKVALSSRTAQSRYRVALPSVITVSHCPVTLPCRIAMANNRVALPFHTVVSHCPVTIPSRYAGSHCCVVPPSRAFEWQSRVAEFYRSIKTKSMREDFDLCFVSGVSFIFYMFLQYFALAWFKVKCNYNFSIKVLTAIRFKVYT